MKTHRRTFVKQSATAIAALSLAPTAWSLAANETLGGSDEILKKLSKINDERIEGLLARQVNKPGDRWDGGVVNAYELPNVHTTNGFLMALGSAYSCSYSGYYQAKKLLKPMKSASECMLRVQHEDGTIDLHSTNFHSTPDTAFLVNFISPLYIVFKRMNRPELKDIIVNIGTFISNAGKCLSVGGIHTPNHRWVVSSALARVNAFFPDQKYVDRMEEWLSEGVDMDPDGQYTEQSVSIYSPTCDNMFLTMARLQNRDDLMDIVRKNLNMTLFYIQPGGEVLTDASGRQDSAKTGYVNEYYYAYRYLAIKDKNPAYAAVCALIERQMPEKITEYISYLLEDTVFEQKMVAPSKIPDNYFKRFEHSGVFRIRRGDADISVIERNPTIMSYMKGAAVLQSVRVAAAFFGSRGQFISQNAEVKGETIIMNMSKTHGYMQPYPEDKRTGDGNWEKMNRALRPASEVQTLNYQLTISENNGNVNFEIEIEGTPHVPVSIELSFRPGGKLSGVVENKDLEDAYFLESGTGQYRHGENVINFGPGIAAHKWAEIRGMLPKQKGESVYLTGYTPFKHTLELS